MLRQLKRADEMEAVLAPVNDGLTGLTGLTAQTWVELFDLVTQCQDRDGFRKLDAKVDSVQNQVPEMNRPVVQTILSFLTVLVERDNYLPQSLNLMLKAVGSRSEEELKRLNILLNPLDGWKDFNPFYREPYGVFPLLRPVFMHPFSRLQKVILPRLEDDSISRTSV